MLLHLVFFDIVMYGWSDKVLKTWAESLIVAWFVRRLDQIFEDRGRKEKWKEIMAMALFC